MTIKYDGEDDGFVGKRQPVTMTQEQDIVERLLSAAKRSSLPGFDSASTLFSEAAQTIAALRAELEREEAESQHWATLAVDDLGKNPPTTWKDIAEALRAERDAARKDNMQAARQNRERAEAAEARIKELEENRDNYRELLQASIANAKDAIRERNDARKELDRCRDRSVVVMIGDTGHYVSQAVADRLIALKEALEPFAEHADEYTDDTPDDCSDWPTFEVGDFRRARAASSDREGGEE